MIQLVLLFVPLVAGGGFNFLPPQPKPVDCVMQYTPWTQCSGNCGTGKQQRWGRILQPALNGGRPCGPLEQERDCDTGIPCTPPPVDCLMQFTDWTPCSGNCGQGKQQRWGTILVQPKNGGLPCEPTEQERTCDTGIPCTPPPVDCVMQFTPWTQCSGNCGTGKQQRWGTILVQPKNGGLPCEPTEQERDCDTGIPCTPPPVDCLMQFTDWTQCSGNCGLGKQQRWGTILVQPKNGGLPCEPTEQERTCDTGIPCTPPPVNCVVEYTPWTQCSGNCGTGRQERWGRITTQPANGGLPCPPLEQSRSCDTGIPCTPPKPFPKPFPFPKFGKFQG